VIVALVAAISANPSSRSDGGSSIIMTFADDGKTPIYENLDDPVPEPLAVDIKQTHFMLYTRNNRVDPQELKVNDPTGLKNSNYNTANPTYVLIHGWQNTHKAESVQIVKDSFLQTSDANVVIFDYEKYNAPYLTAVSNAKAVGGCVAAFVNDMLKNGQTLDKFYLIGHSLGAHIAGYAANQCQGTLGRVTGLDPAGPMFGPNGPDKRLSSDDAKIVDVIHSSKNLGMSPLAGTHDFFPRGGTGQPACKDAATPDGCDHAQSYRYFSETIKNKGLYQASVCKTLAEANVGDPNQNKCVKTNVYMGLDGNKGPKGIYYVEVV